MKLATSLLFSLITSILNSQDVQWKAQWIMHPTADPQEHSVIIFRKNFDLEEKPGNFVIHLSADNHYRLFVNGNYLFRGPARGDLSHWFFETAILHHTLRLVKIQLQWRWLTGTEKVIHLFLPDDKLHYAGATEKESAVNTFGGSWKCLRNEAITPKIVEWMTDRNTIDFGLYVGNPTDSVRADKYPWGWEDPDLTTAGGFQQNGPTLPEEGVNSLPAGYSMEVAKCLSRRTGILVEKKDSSGKYEELQEYQSARIL